ncbi:type II toxin-antitoxin system MqsR family toxin [Siccibacter colletis]|uniref:type II toxin-antitoxin system MqsR family toxin n=1 Tax=Siccibacter colletis TaxID=1505757 RepID=UPI0028BDD7D3|nr:type II toxin-antitoxin system MqsR family toxin [Siccibacter colletis]WNN48669.1 type II toxin-antitoxin system MqsR family toxin [Siccibacter colletis]
MVNEKWTPHTRLHVVKQLVLDGKVRTTGSALRHALAAGYREPVLQQMCDVILRLQPDDFYKSMTTLADHRIWQDVWHGHDGDTALYIKLTVIDDLLIVSYKEL